MSLSSIRWSSAKRRDNLLQGRKAALLQKSRVDLSVLLNSKELDGLVSEALRYSVVIFTVGTQESPNTHRDAQTEFWGRLPIS